MFAQLISGVNYLHQKHIVHRDLKLENLLLDRNRNVIITDFGFANNFSDRAHDLMATSCGSPCYAAPELVVQDGLYNGSPVDIWSCGVILYAMLAGYLPFDDDPANPDSDNINQLYHYILATPLTFPEYITELPRNLLKRMLVPDPAHRASMEEVMSHPWLADFRPLFSFSVEDLEHAAVEQQARKRKMYRQQMELQQQIQRLPTPEVSSTLDPDPPPSKHLPPRSQTLGCIPQAISQPTYRRTAMPTSQSSAAHSSEKLEDMKTPSSAIVNRHTLQVEYSAPASATASFEMPGDPLVPASSMPSMHVEPKNVATPEPMAIDEPTTMKDTLNPASRADVTESASNWAPAAQPSPAPPLPPLLVDPGTPVTPSVLAAPDASPAPINPSAPCVSSPSTDASAPTTPTIETTTAVRAGRVAPDVPAVLPSDPEGYTAAGSNTGQEMGAVPQQEPDHAVKHPNLTPRAASVDQDVLSAQPLVKATSASKASLKPAGPSPAFTPPRTPPAPLHQEDDSAEAKSSQQNSKSTEVPQTSVTANATSIPQTRGNSPKESRPKPVSILSATRDTRARSASVGTHMDKNSSHASRRNPLRSFSYRGDSFFSRILPYRPTSPHGLSSHSSSGAPSTPPQPLDQHAPPPTRRRRNTVRPLSDDEQKAKPSRRRRTMSLIPSRWAEKERKVSVHPTKETDALQNQPSPPSAEPASVSRISPPAMPGLRNPRTLPEPSAVPNGSSKDPVFVDPMLPGTGFRGSTGPAKRVMDWFRRRSCQQSELAALPASFQTASTRAPAAAPLAIAHGSGNDSADETAKATPDVRTKGPSLRTASGSGSAASRETHLTAPVEEPLSQPIGKSGPAAAQGIKPETKPFTDTMLRYHEGAVDQRALKSLPPPELLTFVTAALTSMGIEFRPAKQERFKLECLRPRKGGRPALGSLGASLRTSVFPPSQAALERSSLTSSSHLAATRASGTAGPQPTPTGFRGFLRRASAQPSTPEAGASVSSSVSMERSNSANSTKPTSADGTTSSSTALYGESSVDGGQEVRFSVEITRLKNLPGLYSLDTRRLRGNLWAYKFVYTALLQKLSECSS